MGTILGKYIGTTVRIHSAFLTKHQTVTTMTNRPTLTLKKQRLDNTLGVLGGSWQVISRVTVLITHVRGLITPLRTTHDPPSIG